MDVAHVLDDEFLARLRAWVRRRVGDVHEADDLVQEVAVRLLREAAGVRPETARAYAFTVARHLVVDRHRRRKPPLPLADDPVDGRTDGGDDERGAVAYLSSCLEPMLSALPPGDRDLLLRVDVEDRSQAALARALKVAPSVVRSRVQRARRRLRAELERCCAVERDGRGTPLSVAVRPGAPCPCAPTEDGEVGRRRQGATAAGCPAGTPSLSRATTSDAP